MKMTYSLAHAIGMDAANLQMRQAGRTAWNQEDRELAARTLQLHYPPCLELPGIDPQLCGCARCVPSEAEATVKTHASPHTRPQRKRNRAENPGPVLAPATPEETEEEAEARKQQHEQQRKEYDAEQERKAEECREQQGARLTALDDVLSAVR